VRLVFDHDPNELSEPAALTIFDLAHGVVWFTCERRHILRRSEPVEKNCRRSRPGVQKMGFRKSRGPPVNRGDGELRLEGTLRG
jgi:hypothetical protein